MSPENQSSALDHITISGFKSIARIEKLPLRPINVLIGANGSGKSNFVGAFAFLHAIREGRLRNYVTAAGGAERLLHFGSKTTKQMSFHLFFGGDSRQYELTLAPTADDGLFAADEYVRAWDKAVEPAPSRERVPERDGQREAGIGGPDVSRVASWVSNRLERWRLYHVHDTSASSPLRKTSRIDDNEFLRPDASNLAAFLLFLRERHRSDYELIRKTVQRVAPFFDEFMLKPLRLRPDDIKLEWRHKESDQYFDASSLSDGTLRFIALATLFLQPREYRPALILVDEPELGLHPYAIEMLSALIRQAAIDTQVIVSTQSSLLLDHFDPEDVLVADRVDGGTEIRRLQSEELAGWQEAYSLGQLWEKNEFGGRPSRS